MMRCCHHRGLLRRTSHRRNLVVPTVPSSAVDNVARATASLAGVIPAFVSPDSRYSTIKPTDCSCIIHLSCVTALDEMGFRGFTVVLISNYDDTDVFSIFLHHEILKVRKCRFLKKCGTIKATTRLCSSTRRSIPRHATHSV